MRNTTAPRPDWLPGLLAAREQHRKEAAEILTDARQRADRGVINVAEETEIMRSVEARIPRYPDDYTLGPCPSWCSTDHVRLLGHETVDGERYHEAEFIVDRGQCVSVTLVVYDNLETGERTGPTVRIESADSVTTEAARTIHAALWDAILTAEAWKAGAR